MKTLERNKSTSNLNAKYQKPSAEKFREEKRNFLKEFSTKYGYGGRIDLIREEEYPQLRNEVYLDHTGSTTYAKSAVINFNNDMLNNLYGNPHSQSPSSQASSMRIKGVRDRILRHFNTTEKDYNVVFTQNATASIKLVGEMFPWKHESTYKYLRESHNSVNGLRRFLAAINPDNIQNVNEHDVRSIIKGASRNKHHHHHHSSTHNYGKDDDKVAYSLFAYPAQCNYSGMKFPLSWVHKIKRTDTKHSKTLVLLDAAAYVPTSPLNLADKDASPDFICLSFYKMFGYPTGLGALIVKTELNPILRKGYFGGGTINSVAFDKTWERFNKNIPERYEDGTVNFLNIIALDHAFDAFEKIYGNTKNINNHVNSLVTFLSRSMASFRHWNGTQVVKINSDRDFSDSKRQGGTFSFNVRRSDGNMMGYLEIDKLASSYGIHIRSGGNCNPGSIFRWNGLYSDEVMVDYDEGKFCSDDRDIYKGKLYGAARISIGAMSTIEDILIWLDFFKRHFVEIMPGKTIYDLTAKVPKRKLSKFGLASKRSLNDLNHTINHSSSGEEDIPDYNPRSSKYESIYGGYQRRSFAYNIKNFLYSN